MSGSLSGDVIAEKNNTYPEPVVFDTHYSIMLIAFKHRVNWSNLSNENRRNSYTQLLADHQWHIHDYLVSEQADNGKSKRKDLRRFQPENIMTPNAHEVLFGETLLSGDPDKISAVSGFIADRLNPDIGTVGLSESLMFSLSMSDWLNTPLIASDSSPRIPIEYAFQINWVDLFLYNDGAGMLALRVESLASENGINELSLMNRKYSVNPPVARILFTQQ